MHQDDHAEEEVEEPDQVRVAAVLEPPHELGADVGHSEHFQETHYLQEAEEAGEAEALQQAKGGGGVGVLAAREGARSEERGARSEERGARSEERSDELELGSGGGGHHVVFLHLTYH